MIMTQEWLRRALGMARRGQLNRLGICAAITAVLAIIVLLGSNQNPSPALQRPSTLVTTSPIIIEEPIDEELPYTDVVLGHSALCEAVRQYEEAPLRAKVQSMVASINDADDMSRLTGDALLHKIGRWGYDDVDVAGSDRVLCVGTNYDPNLDRIALQYVKWSRQCDRTLLFVDAKELPRDVPSDVVVDTRPLGGYDASNAWRRFRSIVRHLVNSTPVVERSVTHILFFEDDSYVFIQNLKKMLREPYFATLDRLGVPLLLGHRMVAGTGDVFVSSTSFVVNRVVLLLLASQFDAERCEPSLVTGSLDLPLSRCLSALGITPLDTYDELGEDRFSPFNPWQISDEVNDPKINPWYPSYRTRPMPVGKRALSMFPVALHYMELRHMDEVKKVTEGKIYR